MIAVRRGRTAAAVALTLLSILASPVSGAFVCMGLSGTFLTTRTKAYRPIIAYTAEPGSSSEKALRKLAARVKRS